MLCTASDKMLNDSMNFEKHQKVVLSSSNTDNMGAKKSVIPTRKSHGIEWICNATRKRSVNLP